MWIQFLQKHLVTVSIVVAGVLIVGIILFVRRPPQAGPAAPVQAPAAAPKSSTRLPVNPNTVVPGTDSANLPSNVAKPDEQVQSAPGSSINVNEFPTIRVENNKFSPDTVIVRKGEILRVEFLAVDKDYDFVQPDNGLSTPLPKGQVKRVGFQANMDGKFIFYCERCGGPAKGPVGYFVVVPKK